MRLKKAEEQLIEIPSQEARSAARSAPTGHQLDFADKESFLRARRVARLKLLLLILVVAGAFALNWIVGVATFLVATVLVSAGPWGPYEEYVAFRELMDGEATGVVESRSYTPANVTSRWASELIDLLLQVGPLVAILVLFSGAGDNLIVASVVYAIAFPIVCAMAIGRTPGKALFRISVVKAFGDPPGLIYVIRRELIMKRLVLIIIGPLTLWTALLVDAASPYFDSRRRAYHDRVLMSFVVADRS